MEGSANVIGLAGWSGAGKTTLLAAVLPILTARGMRVSTVKHAHHDFDIDKPGKDSWIHRQAGAYEVMIASARRYALMHELREEAEPDLSHLLARLGAADLVIVEGFRGGDHAKVEVYRQEIGKPLLHPGDPVIAAIVTDAPGPFPIPRVASRDYCAIADLMLSLARPCRVAAQRDTSND